MTSETPDLPEHSDIPANADADNVVDTVVWRFDFRGKTSEFFAIWIVNTLLTVITIGFFAPWAKVRTRRYFYGSAFLNGANFDYHASPWSILFARVVILFIVIGGAYLVEGDLLGVAMHSMLLVFLLPWALVRGLAFNARYSSYRGARFVFHKQTLVAYHVFGPLLVLSVLSSFLELTAPSPPLLGEGSELSTSTFSSIIIVLLLMPWLMRDWHDFKARNHSIGPVQFHFQKPKVIAYLPALWGIPLAGFLIIFIIAVTLNQFGSSNDENNAVIAGLSALMIILLVVTFVGAKLFHIFWNHASFSIGEESGKFKADFSLWEFSAKILAINYVAVFFSLGLLYPWAKIRRAKYLAAHMSLETTPAALDKIPALRGDGETALGEEFEAVEGFDFDVGLV